MAGVAAVSGTLHHVEVYVSDLQRALEFWDWILGELGYKQYQDWPEGRSYKLGDTYLVFVQTEPEYQDIPYHRKRTGLNHLAFWVNGQSEFSELQAELVRRKIPLLYSDNQANDGDYPAIFFEDPDRIKIELVLNPPDAPPS